MKTVSVGFTFCNVMSWGLEVIKMIGNAVASAGVLQVFVATSAIHRPLPVANCYWFGALCCGS